MERVLIIGAQQFIGFHLCSHFLEEGYSVDGVFFEPSQPFYHKWVEEEMLWLGRNAQLSIWTKEDLMEKADVSTYDSIYFCHYDPHDPEWPKDWAQERTVLERVWNVLKEAACPVFLLSSINVFGLDQEKITDEVKPRPSTEKGDFYLQVEKWWTKHVVQSAKSVIVRIPTVFGPWQPPGQWMTDEILKQFTNEPIPTIEKEPIRDLLYIEDVMEAIMELSRDVSNSSSIVHFVSNQFLKKLPDSVSFRIKPIDLQLKNRLVIDQKKEWQQCYDEQRNFIQRFNPYLENSNK